MAKSKKISAGLLMYRIKDAALEVFLAHPGGPYWKARDDGGWSIPKGEVEGVEALEATAVREFEEEIGVAPEGPRIPLGSIKQRGGKTVHAWAFAGDWEDGAIPDSNTFEMEWPRGSGVMVDFPEVDRAQFFSLDQARIMINIAQVAFIDRLEAHLQVD